METRIRWMKRSDLNRVRHIQAVTDPTLPENFVEEELNKSKGVGLVAEFGEGVLGFVFYEITKSSMELTYLAVDPAFRRRGIAVSLMNHLVSKLNGRRSSISVSVCEYNLEMHLFLKSVGFKAVGVLRNSIGGSEYKFLYHAKKPEYMSC